MQKQYLVQQIDKSYYAKFVHTFLLERVNLEEAIIEQLNFIVMEHLATYPSRSITDISRLIISIRTLSLNAFPFA